MTKISAAGALALGLCACAPAMAQTSTAAMPATAVPATPAPSLAAKPIIAVPVATVTQNGSVLPSNTEIVLVANREINSKKIRQGDKFEMSVARDVTMGDYIVIPRGTRAWGQISYRTGKGAFGKSAKMEFDCTDVELNGRMIPVSGHYRIEGQGNTGATVGTVVAAGPFAAFVTGRSAVINQNTEWKAYTKETLPVAIAPATPAPVQMVTTPTPAITASVPPTQHP